MPIKAGLILGKQEKRFNGFVNVGFVPAFLFNTKYMIFPGASKTIEPEVVMNSIRYFSKVDLAALAELGGSFKTGDDIIVFASLSYQQSITKISNVYDTDRRHVGKILLIGIKYNL